MTHSFLIQARYNQKMNAHLYQVCSTLTEHNIMEDRGAFFGSIFGTLNHLLVVDSYWFYQCCQDKALVALYNEEGALVQASSLNELLTKNFTQLHTWRKSFDQRIVDYIETLSEQDLARTIPHRSSDGTYEDYPIVKVLAHWFNHQTHHRGQITTLLSQMGVDFGCTDLLRYDV